MRIVLASGSPRRSRILSDLGFEFEVEPYKINEDTKSEESPVDHVLRLSSIKAKMGAEKHPQHMVIGADTAVAMEGEIFGKPATEQDAFDMLAKLSGKKHTVFTGLSVIILNKGIHVSGFDKTEVIFNELSSDKIWEYVKSGEPLDKAGSYGIQGMGSFLVKSYSGELDTVVGFPSKLFNKMYEEAISCLNR